MCTRFPPVVTLLTESPAVAFIKSGRIREVVMSEHETHKKYITFEDLAYGYEDYLKRNFIHIESVLIEHAETLHGQAIDHLSIYRSRDLPAVNLGIVLRIRNDTLGPRIDWVRFKGKSRVRDGLRFTPTEPIKARGKYQYNSNIFQKFPDDIRIPLIKIEQQLAVIRFRTARLAALRDLCRQKSTYLPKE
jgi:hypothetical protein